jgi:hypothetical protein
MKNSKKIGKKPGYKLGALLKQNGKQIGQGLELAGQVGQAIDPTNTGIGNVLGRAGLGAQIGSTFGPVGSVAGGAVGLIGGAIESIFNSGEEEKKVKEMNRQKEAATTSQLISNSGAAFAKGGKMNNLQSKLGVIQGGTLQPISKDAVEVKANNPTQTDSVELDNAYVDHNEVIDRKNRVFSDELGFAKQAKKLEKQKSKSSRFTASNERIEQQLDNLFQEQESMKKGMTKGGKYKMLTGGEIDPNKPKVSRITNQPYKDEIEYTREQYDKGLIPQNEEYVINYFKRNPKTNRVLSGTAINNGAEFPNQVVDAFDDVMQKSVQVNPRGQTALTDSLGQVPATDVPIYKPKNAVGGRLGKLSTGLDKSPLDKGFYKTEAQQRAITLDTAKTNKGLDFDKLKTGLATFGPNIASALAQNKLRGPATPQMEKAVGLKRLSANDQLAEVERQGLQANQVIKNNTAQAADIASATGNIFAKKVAAKNQIFGENQRLNAAIQGQEAALNTQINARNTERTNQFNNDINDFSNLKQRLGTDNVANLSSKVLQQGREKNQMDLDKFSIKYMGRKFKDSGVQDRNLDDITEEEQKKYLGKKNGGIIPKKLAKKIK